MSPPYYTYCNPVYIILNMYNIFIPNATKIIYSIYNIMIGGKCDLNACITNSTRSYVHKIPKLFNLLKGENKYAKIHR